MFEWISDPTIWVGLLTLIILEIVLGIDNLVFIAILADKLPPKQRDQARIIGLSFALGMRVALLFSISWVVTLTEPLFSVFGKAFSGRDLILLLGGVFLLFKATMELHERLEGGLQEHHGPRMYAGFWAVVAQIVVLDAVFSLDSVITAVGMVDDLPVMIAAVVIAMVIMIIASKPLTAFVNAHPTVVVLCLGFLLMIGFALVAEGMGFDIPKGYLYAAIGFSVLIEIFNQLALFNRRRFLAGTRPLRERTADAVIRLLGGRPEVTEIGVDISAMTAIHGNQPTFTSTERGMIQSVLQLAERPIEAVMTPRPDIVWLDIAATPDEIRQALEQHPHNRLLVARDELDQMAGIVETRTLAAKLLGGGPLDLASMVAYQPLGLPEGMSALHALESLRQHPVPVGVVVNEYGGIEGLITANDLLVAITGDLAQAGDKMPSIVEQGAGAWLLDGSLDLGRVEELLDIDILPRDKSFHTLAGLVLAQLQHVPKPGEGFDLEGYRFDVVAMDGHRIVRISVVRTSPARTADEPGPL